MREGKEGRMKGAEILFQEAARRFGLGKLTSQPQRVAGGFLHKMYRIETESGAYALKLLNPTIMKRPDAMGNFRRAERLERILQENGIPLVPALEKDGEKMQCLEGQYYYLFAWSEGKALGWHEITEEHCRIAGRLLARIHRIPCKDDSGSMERKGNEGEFYEYMTVKENICQHKSVADGQSDHVVRNRENEYMHKDKCQSFWEVSGQQAFGREVSEQEDFGQKTLDCKNLEPENLQIEIEKASAEAETILPELFSVDWDGYIKQAAEACPEMAVELAENRELLYRAQREYNAAIESVPRIRCICDGDMDCKNVLWEGKKPLLIDLECLDYGNPFTEMFQLALSWAGGAVCELDLGRFRAFVEAYRQEYGEVPVDWKTLSSVGFSWLDWFAYNVRRGLGIECGDEEERQLGICEARETMRRIRYYDSVRGKLI